MFQETFFGIYFSVSIYLILSKTVWNRKWRRLENSSRNPQRPLDRFFRWNLCLRPNPESRKQFKRIRKRNNFPLAALWHDLAWLTHSILNRVQILTNQINDHTTINYHTKWSTCLFYFWYFCHRDKTSSQPTVERSFITTCNLRFLKQFRQVASICSTLTGISDLVQFI